MNEIQNEINNAYMILSTARVHGDLVDVVAACRAALRNAYNLAGQEEAAPAESQTGAPTEAQRSGFRGEKDEQGSGAKITPQAEAEHSGLCEDVKEAAET